MTIAQLVRAELAVPSRTELGIAGRLVGVSSTGELALIPQRMSDTPAVLERVFPGAGGPRAVADHVVDGGFGPADELIAVRAVDGERRSSTRSATSPHVAARHSRRRGSHATTRTSAIEKVSAIETRGRVTILDRAGAVIASSSYHGGVIGLVWAPDDREVWFSTWTGDDADNGLFALDLAGHERLLLRGGGVYWIARTSRATAAS